MSQTIAFFGSGPVAAASLRLLAQDFDIEAVITKPRPPHHKGDVPVEALAQELGLTIHYAADKQQLDELFASRPVRSELAVLIDFGIIVSQAIIDYFPLGIINSHFSLLPQWRGADPITFAVLSGQAKTGVSLMLLSAGMDEGNILSFGEYDLPADITTPQLTHELTDLSHALLSDMLPRQFDSPSSGMPQSVEGISYSRKLTKADSILDFQKSAIELEREIRAFLEWPRSRTTLASHPVIITKAHVETGQAEPGTIYHIDKQLGIYTAQDILMLDRLIPAGKKEMPAQAFLAGYSLD